MYFTKENHQSIMSSHDDGNISVKWISKLPETYSEPSQTSKESLAKDVCDSMPLTIFKKRNTIESHDEKLAKMFLLNLQYFNTVPNVFIEFCISQIKSHHSKITYPHDGNISVIEAALQRCS